MSIFENIRKCSAIPGVQNSQGTQDADTEQGASS